MPAGSPLALGWLVPARLGGEDKKTHFPWSLTELESISSPGTSGEVRVALEQGHSCPGSPGTAPYPSCNRHWPEVLGAAMSGWRLGSFGRESRPVGYEARKRAGLPGVCFSHLWVSTEKHLRIPKKCLDHKLKLNTVFCFIS